MWPFAKDIVPFGVSLEVSHEDSGGLRYLSFENFAKLIDKNRFIKKIEIARNRYVLLNPYIVRMLKYAYKLGVRLSIRLGVVLECIDDEVLEAILRFNLTDVHIIVNGSSQEAYSHFRPEGIFDNVVADTRKLVEYNRKYGNEGSDLVWQYDVLPYNDSEKEIKRAKKIAEDIGIGIYFRRGLNKYIPRNIAMVERETGLDYSTVNSFKSGGNNLKLSSWEYPCFLMWTEPAIGYDGKFYGCIYEEPHNGYNSVNAFESNIEQCLESNAAKFMKNMMTGRALYKNAPCYICKYYHNMVKENKFINHKEMSGNIDNSGKQKIHGKSSS